MNHSENPYYSIGKFYRNRFGVKLKKIPVTIADDCPNRRGLKKMETCIFCDAWGSAAYNNQGGVGLEKQISEKISYYKEKYNAENFLVYFQAYTSTFLGVKSLKQSFETALSFPQVKGIVIGTRPDCLSDAVLDLWREIEKRTFLSVELGVQTLRDDKLMFLKRGHTAQVSLDGIKRIRANAPGVDLGVHLMFGLPDETDIELIEAAEILSELQVDNVKLHNLHVLVNTPLEKLYLENKFQPISLEEYARRVGLFLRHLSPEIAVHRLSALSSRWEELVAPEWTKHKMKNYQYILNFMRQNKISQGDLHKKNLRREICSSAENFLQA